MKNLIRASILLVALYLVAPAQAMAQGIGQFGFHPYMGVGLGVYNMKLSVPGYSQTNSEFGGYLQAGVDFNEYLGAELRIGGDAKGSSSVFGVVNLSQQDEYLFSYLLKLQYPVAPELRIYGLVGGTTGRVKVGLSVPGFAGLSASQSFTKTGVSFGAGVDYKLPNQLRAGLEWVRYMNDVTISSPLKHTIDGYTATLKYMF